ncbi:hypothetical protein WH87_07265 [Devosia epidermidihirudinis]|uniref:Uncharacterized protein n=1 Tax=Devosia epidermidihirudinis TaxID=1293439 RepID=A0A0F5QCJ7_9HYPH|nr:hypothetical protein [Devosia epidermidihirudinis]KKC38717.1 hypothetical protein WH87_07265 [Devosia epidermidihirudinis]
MTVKLLAALAATALLTFAVPSFAQEEEVSDDVDIALWCGAAYTVVTKIDGVSAEDAAEANKAADAAFAKAHAALIADNIEEAEYDRLVEFYVEAAVEDMTNAEADLRYSDEDCSALINS